MLSTCEDWYAHSTVYVIVGTKVFTREMGEEQINKNRSGEDENHTIQVARFRAL